MIAPHRIDVGTDQDQYTRPMDSLAAFIRGNSERILSEWETFARALPAGASMDVGALRDHAKAMLAAIALDLETPQTPTEQRDKAKGESDLDARQAPTAAAEHGSGRAEVGFTVEQMVAEFRALRASVTRLWTAHQRQAGPAELDELIRFNEAIDQAIAESLTRYTRQIDRTKERFLAILGHDLRTPLGAIITSAQFMLEMGGLDKTHLKLVTGIANSSRRMNQMVADLLDFALTRFGDSIPITRGAMDVGETTRAVVAEVAASHPESKLTVETSGDLRGDWDSDRLAQALTNVVANAVEHGANAAPITITARGEPTEVTVAVQNGGPPIPAEELAQIFDAMKRKPSQERDRRHLGLGLFIVDKIVAAHGGHVDVDSSAERGTTFTVHLPRNR